MKILVKVQNQAGRQLRLLEMSPVNYYQRLKTECCQNLDSDGEDGREKTHCRGRIQEHRAQGQGRGTHGMRRVRGGGANLRTEDSIYIRWQSGRFLSSSKTV